MSESDDTPDRTVPNLHPADEGDDDPGNDKEIDHQQDAELDPEQTSELDVPGREVVWWGEGVVLAGADESEDEAVARR